MAEQNNEFVMKNHETRRIGFASFPKVNIEIFDLYFHGCDNDMDMVI